MEAFLNGCLAKVVLNGDEESSDKIRDLITCCYHNSLQLDPRIEHALCLRSLKTHVKDQRLDRETFILFSKLAPLPSQDENCELHLELLTQVFLKEEGITLDEAFAISKEHDRGENWMNSMYRRKQHLNTILSQIEERNLALLEIKAQFPKQLIITQLSQFLDQKIKESKLELSKLQEEATEIMKLKKFSSEVLNLVDSTHEKDNQSKASHSELVSIEELAKRVVYDREDLQIPKILPTRFQKAAKDAQNRIEELKQNKLNSEEDLMLSEAVLTPPTGLSEDLKFIKEMLKDLKDKSEAQDRRQDQFSARLDDITEHLKSLTPQSLVQEQEPPHPSGDRSPNRCSSTTEEQLKEVLKECEEIQREFDLERGLAMMPQVVTVRKRSAQECLTEARKKNKKPSLLSWQSANTRPNFKDG